MSAAIDRYDISLIDAFLRDQLDAETSESFELRMLGDADFAVVVAQRRAMIDAVDRAVRPATSSRSPEGDGERDQGAIEALLAWFTGPAWSGVATAGFALCAALLVFEPAGLASLSAAAPPGRRPSRTKSCSTPCAPRAVHRCLPPSRSCSLSRQLMRRAW